MHVRCGAWQIRKFDDTAKTIEYAKMLERAGASVLAIHGRTREMKDSSKFLADWDIIREVQTRARNVPPPKISLLRPNQSIAVTAID
jgi:tRNA-dihydrouridine synthase